MVTPDTVSGMTVGPDPARESSLMHGVLDTCVLAILQGESLHAYGIVERLNGHGFDNVSYGTIYPLITRLRKQGLLEQSLVPSPSGPARNMLTLNDNGRQALNDWSQQWRDVTTKAAALLDPHTSPTEKALAHDH